ncbi:hypothetical protein HID58_078191, partial [Brassica napus]
VSNVKVISPNYPVSSHTKYLESFQLVRFHHFHSKIMKPVFCGNFEYDAREGDLERLFGKHGKVDRVDMKAVPYSAFSLTHDVLILGLPYSHQSMNETIRKSISLSPQNESLQWRRHSVVPWHINSIMQGL